MRMAQIRARGTFQGEGVERHPRLLAEFAQRQSQVDVQRQVVGRDLVENRRYRHPVAVLDERPDQWFVQCRRSDGVAHGNPAAARCLIHDERRPIRVEQQILVAEQREIRRGVVSILDQLPPRGRDRPDSAARSAASRGAAGATARRRRRSWPPAAKRADCEAPAPRMQTATTIHCCKARADTRTRPAIVAAPSTNSTATTQDAEKRCSISEARRRKRSRADTSTTATAPSIVASS